MDVRVGQERRTVDDETELLALLDEPSESPRLVLLVAETGALGIGVGHPEHSVVLYNPKGALAPMHGLGNADVGQERADPPLTFDGREFFARCAVTRAVAREAAREFLSSDGARPASVVWEAEPRSVGDAEANATASQ